MKANGTWSKNASASSAWGRNVLPHPAEILLCDVYAKRQTLEILAQSLRDHARFQGRIRIVTAEPNVPAAFYEATLIVGATNVPDILDVSCLQPGTLIVDDSAPHCFNPKEAVERFGRHRDAGRWRAAKFGGVGAGGGVKMSLRT